MGERKKRHRDSIKSWKGLREWIKKEGDWERETKKNRNWERENSDSMQRQREIKRVNKEEREIEIHWERNTQATIWKSCSIKWKNIAEKVWWRYFEWSRN